MARDSILVAVTGGIGSGKSVVSRMLRIMGETVYDCDSRAKVMMDRSATIKNDIARLISADVICGGNIDRGRLSEIVFADIEKLKILNGIVHKHVRDDIGRLREETSRSVIFVETAILFESGLDTMVEQVWNVSAPDDLRVRRVMKRNSIGAEAVLARMRAQAASEVAGRVHPLVYQIINDDVEPLLPRVLYLLGKVSERSV